MNPSTTENCPDCGRPIPEGAPQGFCPKCLLSEAAIETVNTPGSRGKEPTMEEVAAAFPALELLEQIGEGGMGVVYKARQRRLDRIVALKLLRCPPEQEEHFAERFLREARALAKLNHPHIVTVYDFGESGGYFYLLMEYVDGVNLRQAMKGESLSPEEALRIVPVVCEALQYAHEHGVLHRDIKPANILLTRTGDVKMADFGLAKFVGETNEAGSMLTQTEASLGTPAYMAPEQTTDPSRVDHRADIYSLGVVFYEMLTGDLPLGRFPAPSKKATTVDRRVDEVVMRTLEREPDERYQSAKDVQTDVEHLSTATPGKKIPNVAHEPVMPAAVPQPRRVLWQGVFAAIMVLLSLLIIAILNASIGAPELILVIVILAIPGTIMGWVAANRIRVNREAYVGLPFAGFAALCWPALFVAGVNGALATFIVPTNSLWFLCMLIVPLLLYLVLTNFLKWLRFEPTSLRYAWVFLAIFIGIRATTIFREHVLSVPGRNVPFELAWTTDQLAARRISKGANVNERNDYGSKDTALMIAAREGAHERVRLLLNHGADAELRNTEGYTAFLLGARHGHIAVLRALLEHGANIQATLPDTKENALHLAAHHQFHPTVGFLMDRGLRLDSRTNKGQTPLMLAVSTGNNVTVTHLLNQYNRDVSRSLVDNDGRTALDYALLRGSFTIAKNLLAHGLKETPSWWFFHAQRDHNLGWNRVIAHLQSAQRALESFPVENFRFGLKGWQYTMHHPDIVINAMLVEAAALAGESDVAEQAWRDCLAEWPPDEESLILYERQDQADGVDGEQAKTIQTLALKREDIDHPLRSENQAAVLAGTSRTITPDNRHIDHPLTGNTLFR